MSPGKLASQAGHAYLEAFLSAHPDLTSAYRADGLGTKICLIVPTLAQLMAAHDHALQVGLPCALITDSGRNTCFHGIDTVTALGIGPVARQHVDPITKQYKLMP